MELNGKLSGVVQYATNDLEIMVPARTPQHIESLKDLARPGIYPSLHAESSVGRRNTPDCRFAAQGWRRKAVSGCLSEQGQERPDDSDRNPSPADSHAHHEQASRYGVDLGLRGSLSG